MSELRAVPPQDYEFVFDQADTYYIYDALQRASIAMTKDAPSKSEVDKAVKNCCEAMGIIEKLMRQQA